MYINPKTRFIIGETVSTICCLGQCVPPVLTASDRWDSLPEIAGHTPLCLAIALTTTSTGSTLSTGDQDAIIGAVEPQ